MRRMIAILVSVLALAACGEGSSVTDRPDIQLNQNVVDFGRLIVGTEEQRYVFVQNNGGAALQVLEPSITGPDQPLFALPANMIGGIVGPGSALTLEVSFQPDSEGAKSAHLLIPHDAINTASPISVPLKGEGVEDRP